jgi:membrane protease YdiL (CAAX protease family)
MKFIKQNIVYIALALLMVTMNVSVSRDTGGKSISGGAASESFSALPETDEKDTLFVRWDEAKKNSRIIEEKMRGNMPLTLLYVSFNLLIFLFILLGIWCGGFFIYRRFKGIQVIPRLCDGETPLWELADVFRVIVVAFGLSYSVYFFTAFFLELFMLRCKTDFNFISDKLFGMMSGGLILDTMFLITIAVFARVRFGKGILDLGISKENRLKGALWGIAGYTAVVPVIVFVGIIVYVVINAFHLKAPPVQPVMGLMLSAKNVPLLLSAFAVVIFLAPLAEEVFFRGVLYNAVKRKLGVLGGILLTSALFSLLHTYDSSFFLVGFLPVAILGGALAYLYEKTGSLVPSITLHIAHNLSSVIVVFAEKFFSKLL